MIAPLWLVASPAMTDYPSHLATYYLLDGGAHDRILSNYYAIQWNATPDLGFEALVPLLANFVTISVATKLVLSAAIMSWVASPQLIHRVLYGRFGVGPVLGSFFACNVGFATGYLNWYLATGLALLAFALWLALRERKRAVLLPIFSIITLGIYFCHLVGALVLLIAIGTFELWLAATQRKFNLRACLGSLGRTSTISLPTAFVFMFLTPHGNDNRLVFNLIGSLVERVQSAMTVTLANHGYPVLLAVTLFVVIGLWRGWVIVHRRMVLTLTTFCVAALFAPVTAMGGTGANIRLPPVVAVLVFASLEVALPLLQRSAVATGALLALAIDSTALSANWSHYDSQYREFRDSLKSLPRGTALLPVLDGKAIGRSLDQPYIHIAEFGIIDRSDYSPLLFASKGQQVVRLKRDIVEGTPLPPTLSTLEDIAAGRLAGSDRNAVLRFPALLSFRCRFDDVVLISFGGKPSRVPNFFALRRRGSVFAIYDIGHSGCPKPLNQNALGTNG